jgi:phospholipid/cholesterol/gamma-HCH transport system substrate-binding protein
MPRPKRQPYALYGVAMLSVIALLTTLSIMAFKQEFTTSTPVTMRITRAGLQLLKGSDVKMRGLIVGDVKSIDSTGDGATIQLQLNPKMIKDIPENVQAQLIPKTVFGEKYINLVTPANPSPQHIASGGVIAEDHSTPALEIDQALNDLLPLLRTVRPQDLNSTLSAVASALSGRGQQLGETTVKLQNYLDQLNPHLPQIQHDFQALAKVATTYDQAAPALLALLRNFSVTSKTITDKSAAFSSLLKDLTGTALTTRDFVARNAENIVAVNVVNKNFLALLAEYSPEYDCLFKGTANLLPRIKAAKDTKHTAAVRVELHGPKPAYIYPLDAPEYNDYRGPACYGLPNPPMTLPTIQFKDGTEDDPRFADRNGHTDAQPLNLTYQEPGGGSATNPLAPLAPLGNALSPLTSTLLGPSSAANASPSMGDAGSAGEQLLMNQVLGPIIGEPADKVPAIDDLLWGPLARGSQVNVG